VRPIIAADAAKASGEEKHTLAEVATSELVWPTRTEYSRLYNYADVSGKLQHEYLSIFQSAMGE
jgi:spermidine/putrescine transport system substrate-binding protein